MEPIDIKQLSNNNVLELFQVLTSTSPEQEKIKKAENIIEKYINIPESLDGCLYQLKTNTDVNTRHFSTLILYKSVDHNWNKISEQKKKKLKRKY